MANKDKFFSLWDILSTFLKLLHKLCAVLETGLCQLIPHLLSDAVTNTTVPNPLTSSLSLALRKVLIFNIEIFL
jgi:hypothetical protein